MAGIFDYLIIESILVVALLVICCTVSVWITED